MVGDIRRTDGSNLVVLRAAKAVSSRTGITASNNRGSAKGGSSGSGHREAQ
jgi:hypothetical protein